MRLSKYAIVLVEGETEKFLINDLKSYLKYPIKRVIKANLWNNNIKKIIPSLTEQSDILIIFDTDKTENLQRFKDNLNFLKSKKHSIFLFQQISNFEEEIAYASSTTTRKLLTHFCSKIISPDNFKGIFNSQANRLQRLDEFGLKKEKLWERKLIKPLNTFNEHHSSHEKYFIKK
ncbi:TPA: hypothetical protein PIO68_004233 [Klebsiella pneumoniae]|nr:hypothetical protein [Klebsiella pneumoniae]HDH0614062.1 hypothetical protein [Klebsiella pneumoniae]